MAHHGFESYYVLGEGLLGESGGQYSVGHGSGRWRTGGPTGRFPQARRWPGGSGAATGVWPGSAAPTAKARSGPRTNREACMIQ